MDLHSQFEESTPAIVLAEGEFGRTGGKTANGVVLHSDLFEARVVIDSTTAGMSVPTVLKQSDAPDIPIVDGFETATQHAPEAEALIVGVAPAGGALPESWVDIIQDAMRAGCDVVSGLHVFLGDDPDWTSLANECGVRLFDVRKAPPDSELRVADGRTTDLDADIVLTMGTDCAVGKRTTTFELYQAARAAGLDAGWVATGQTGTMIGADRGVVIDRIPADFAAGAVEDLVYETAQEHDIVFVEGQAALTHRAYSGVTLAILHGAWPDVVVLADDPSRSERTHFKQFAVDGVERERETIESLSDATVAAISTWGSPEKATAAWDLPAANVFEDGGPAALLDAVQEACEAQRVVP
ncbi:hypothetical protein AUR64_02330 [Haloprofundus marisrubri]|uniref:DUF1611 domain-containing protein n=1 Tax=Haloprofundus marisrubri TaxID=1514971 RepID=A0A0W1R307_9EURY|nr:DUF1611 domain-containing protein [Haloprofundus marisrubri]KTG07698.1 hypothetical protein AUR64_02330 [Haloprofundus marisrubri]